MNIQKEGGKKKEKEKKATIIIMLAAMCEADKSFIKESLME